MIHAAIVGLGRWGRNPVGSVQGRGERPRFTHAVVRRPGAARATEAVAQSFASGAPVVLGER